MAIRTTDTRPPLHPAWRKHLGLSNRYLRAKQRHEGTEFPDDLSAARSYRLVLEAQLDANKCYIANLEAGIPLFE